MNSESRKSGRIAVLISGFGSNLQALLDTQARGDLHGCVCAVISDQPEAFGLQRARAAGIEALCLAPGEFADRPSFDSALGDLLEQRDIGLIVLAGFMRILGPAFVDRFAGCMLNVHPSLLPDYRGLHTHERVLAAGEPQHGATVHFVTAELDGGPRVIQYRLAIKPEDTPESLSARVQAGEHMIFPRAAGWFAAGRLTMQQRQPYLDGKLLAEPILVTEDDHD